LRRSGRRPFDRDVRHAVIRGILTPVRRGRTTARWRR
jgi:hypothetical protein